MRTKISRSNPYGANRYGFLWECLQRQPGGRHLDYGAYDGSVIRVLVETGVVHSADGVDINRAVVEAHKDALPPDAQLHLNRRGNALPFPDASFDSASMLDVLEHVADQASVLAALHRVLKPGGMLVVTVPGKHLFSFLDTGNFKFRFPQLHRWLYLRRHTEAAYRARYVENPDGLVGDIEQEKGWHQHFSRNELQQLLAENGFAVRAFDGSGFFSRLLLPFRLLSPAFLRPLWERVLAVDARLFSRTNLFCRAERVDRTRP